MQERKSGQATLLHSAWDLDLELTRPATTTLSLLYYLRWHALLDGQPVPLHPEASTGYASLSIPSAGRHHLVLNYGSTPAEMAGITVSGLAVLVLLGLLGVGLWNHFRMRAGPLHRPFAPLAVNALHSSQARYAGVLLVLVTALLIFKIAYVDGHTTWFRCVSTQDRVCGAQVSTQARFAQGIHLRGYELPSSQARAGGSLAMTVYWQIDHKIDRPLWSFVHVRNKQKDWPVNPETGSDIWAQEDRIAPAGLSVRDFVPGLIYADGFEVALPAGMPPGEYLLEVGWADPATGEQLDVEQVDPPLSVLWCSLLLPSVHVQ
jgi:hypothetical protein